MISRALNLFFISLLPKRPKVLVLEIKEYLLGEDMIKLNEPDLLEQSKCNVTFLELKVVNDKISMGDKEFDGIFFGRSTKQKQGTIQIMLRPKYISREHGVIFLENNVLCYADKSSNGSFVQNASKKSRRIEVHNSTLELQNDDVIMIGKTPAADGKYFCAVRIRVIIR